MKKPNGNKVYRKLYIETSIQKVAEVLFLFQKKNLASVTWQKKQV